MCYLTACVALEEAKFGKYKDDEVEGRDKQTRLPDTVKQMACVA